MSLEDYRVFDAIAKEKSLVRAADALHLAASTVSHSLSRLEKQLGFTLLIRNSHTVELTANGRHLLPFDYAAAG